MKKLKKGLSLVLVLVMVFGLATNAFAWDTTYADNDQITYKEAVEAMSGMGIIDGKLDNMFDPAGDYTREQAAKVITYMLLGPEAAKVLEQPTNTGFSDVDAGRWSSGYIAYAAAQDIIVGWGGEFHPEDTLTRAQWLKMLLVALGYDPIENGLEDNLNWETNALTLALKVKLIDSKEATATFNRELAVQYGFKALQTKTVDKDGKETGKKLSQDIFNLTNVPTKYDEFGRPYETWDNGETGNDQVVYATNYAEPVLTYSNKEVAVRYAEESLGEGADIKEIYINGVKSEEQLTEIGGRSTEVEIYKNSDNTYTAIVIELQVKKLEKTNLKDKAFADFEEGDVVTYFQGKDGDKNVYSNVTKVEPVEGTITAVATEYIRLDGEQIFKAENLPENVKDELAPNAKVNAYIDSYGNLIYAEVVQPAEPEERQPDGYAYMLDSEAKAGASASAGGGLFGDGATEEKAAAARAKIIDLTAGAAGDKAKVVDIAVVKNAETSEWYYANENGTASEDEVTADDPYTTPGFYAYYILDDGTYVFESANSTQLAVQADKAWYANASAYATKDTELTIVYVDDASNPTEIKSVETYTGYTNFPKDGVTSQGVYVTKDGNITQMVLMVTATTTPDPEPEQIYAVAKGNEEETADGWRYDIYIPATGKTVEYVSEKQETALQTDGKVVLFTVKKGTTDLDSFVEAADPVSRGVIDRFESTYITLKDEGNNKAYTLVDGYYCVGIPEVGANVELYGSDKDNIEFVNVIPEAE